MCPKQEPTTETIAEGPGAWSEELLFRQLPDWLQQALRDLSRSGYIYIGRSGAGLTATFRQACMKAGTIRVIDKVMEYNELESKLLVELIATEGPRWVSYRRILEYASEPTYQTIRQREP